MFPCVYVSLSAHHCSSPLTPFSLSGFLFSGSSLYPRFLKSSLAIRLLVCHELQHS
jgi:hypothetical protein